ncbi:MAG: Flagellar biosynthetic protein FliP [Chlamydiales bacterium]|nr:Flagellar biosynthetic protein FliP [Chlamydiales bacterium]MCH9620478.1 Flagellar biosynthetic protein FliP [Chlamydiales bacterium]MCH9623463.1 Flagellar biosynthetic protein FliP [Chlamydiales bacterium]
MLEHFHVVGITVILALIPFVFVLMTSFTRISIVLTFLRQALSTSVPSTQVIIGLSLILTAYVMHPVISEIQKEAINPYFEGAFKHEEPMEEGKAILSHAWPPLRTFMLFHTREKDLQLFLEMGNVELPQGEVIDPHTLPWYCIIPAFVLSELRTAFMLGFLLFLPFLVIDMVVTSLLMSMGMILLPPVMISFPIKILLFVVVDGWRLIMQQVVHGY